MVPTRLSAQLLATLLLLAASSSAYPQGIFFEKVRVRRASTFDWEFAAKGLYAGQGDADERLANYSATKQLYDLFGPRQAPARPMPLILYVAPGNTPRWDSFAWTCRRQGVLFAAARAVGNHQHPAIRCRATLDVLADVRRRYRVDPDRTYIAGFSGGAVIANKLALALPECFGGLMCMGQRVSLHGQLATVSRAANRIDIIALCGGNELVGPEVEWVDVPVARAWGFRAASMVTRQSGHKPPPPDTIEAAYKWLDDTVEKRRHLAEASPATRIDWQRRFDPAAWGQSLVEELESHRVKEPERALALARFVGQRFSDGAPAEKAAEAIAALEQASDVAAHERQRAETVKRDVSRAMLEGYQRAAQDRRASLSRQRKSDFAKVALRYLEVLEPKPEDFAERVAAMEKVIAKAE